MSHIFAKTNPWKLRRISKKKVKLCANTIGAVEWNLFSWRTCCLSTVKLTKWTRYSFYNGSQKQQHSNDNQQHSGQTLDRWSSLKQLIPFLHHLHVHKSASIFFTTLATALLVNVCSNDLIASTNDLGHSKCVFLFVVSTTVSFKHACSHLYTKRVIDKMVYVHCGPNTIKSNEINSFTVRTRYINTVYGYKTWYMQTARAI